MSPTIILVVILLYFLTLMGIGWVTGKDDSNASFFTGNKKSPWYLVAFGMIGASLSGVTFISVPGWVASSQFSYMQMVLGYFVGYLVIAFVLMPLYYRLNLITIYTYLERRFGQRAYLTGSFFFLLSRTIGSAFRLYLVAIVLQLTVFDALQWSVPFWLTVVITIALIWLYTFRGGIKTIIYTDTLQTAFMLISVIISVWSIKELMNWDLASLFSIVKESDYAQIWFFDDVNDKRYFWKQFLAGVFIAISMTGLDQDMMQKNLTCKNIGDAQKNMLSMSTILIFVNLLFLSLGVLLYVFAAHAGFAIPEKPDQLFPALAVSGLMGPFIGLFFILGLIAAAYSSADSALTALTTTFSIDFLQIEKKPTEIQKKLRMKVHIAFSLLLMIVIILFERINDDSVISEVFTAAGYTYGPLLGLFSLGLLTKAKVPDHYIPYVCFLAPLLCYLLQKYSMQIFSGYQIGFELLLLNGLVTALGVWLTKFVVRK